MDYFEYEKHQTLRAKHFTLSELKEDGWTLKQIKELLKQPDTLADNPRHRNAAKMQLYKKSRVRSCITRNKLRPVLDANLEKRERNKMARRQAARKAVETKEANLIKQVEANLVIELPDIPYKDLVTMAWQHRDAIAEERGRGSRRGHDGKDYERRIVLNLIRHELTDYDYYLSQLHGSIGRDNAYEFIRGAVHDAACEKWPQLVVEAPEGYQRKDRDTGYGESKFKVGDRVKTSDGYGDVVKVFHASWVTVLVDGEEKICSDSVLKAA